MPPGSSNAFPSGLYIVAVPIGHYDDIGLRALSLLSCAHFILCEDTRQTLSLLRSHSILVEQRLLSADEHRWVRHQPLLKKELIEGESIVVFVSDAGTPGVCDPGAALVHWLREQNYHKITALPGPSALATFLSLAGRLSGSILFTGFFPRKTGLRQKLFDSAASSESFCVGFESPRRVQSLLEDFIAIYGREPRIVIGRELTKTHEQIYCGSVGEALDVLGTEALPTLGEWVIGFEVPLRKIEAWKDIAQALSSTWEKKKLSQWLADHFHISKNEAYDFLIGKSS